MKTYLFDFDGTLVDSMPTFIAVMLRILDENGITYDDSIVKTITPLGYKGTAEHFATLGVKISPDEQVRIMNEYARVEYAENIMAKHFVKETLEKLRRSGNSLNILTASLHSMLDVCLKRLGLYSLFDNVWSCDDFGMTKADPEIYRAAAKRLGVETADVIFLDDNIGALKTAKSSGMKIYGVYDPSSDDYKEEIKNISDRYITEFSELL